MNEHLNHQEANSPEKQRRAEIVSELLRDSEGSVALYTTIDLNQDEKSTMLQAQSERIGQPADSLRRSNGGWGDYGERPAVNPSTRANGPEEAVRFVTLENGSVDVRYNFWQPGYQDDTGRPGNALNVQFVVDADNAATLRQALEADPSFINDVVEAQAKAVGVSDKRWATKMAPHYYQGFNETVKRTDRVLKLQEVGSDGTVDAEEALRYGENKSILTDKPTPQENLYQTSNESQVPIETVPQTSNDFLSDEEWAQEVQKSEGVVRADVARYKVEGQTTQKIIAMLNENITFDEAEIASSKNLTERQIDLISTEVIASRKLVQELTHQLDQEAHAESARLQVEQVLGTVEYNTGQIVTYGGENVTIIDTYNDASGNQWLELRGANGNRQIMASKINPSV